VLVLSEEVQAIGTQMLSLDFAFQLPEPPYLALTLVTHHLSLVTCHFFICRAH
jgi:hypothetical protein